ncbi:phosphoglyceromutase [Enhygromyxa salina]|uniref:Phosphoglyceromutase n=1 Tax=Enhygromyxa salina TaxID=215803 RepID=A0A2S9XEA7_9BACT|nr:histidine phosphatase family protein [Enhygromyxa salina]PRP91208.1 phosphoglyceromutase [Enhygromyxa salina]
MSTRRVVVALVRHGDYQQPDKVPSAQLPHPLTERGVEQAQALGHQLHDECRGLGLMLDPVLDCSILLRASQTATLAATTLNELEKDLHFSIAEFAELGERSVGAGANLTVDEIAAAVRADPRLPSLPDGWKSHPRYRLPLPGSESLMMAGARVAAHVAGRAHELRTAGGDDVLKVVVGHGGSLRHAAVCLGALDLDDVPGLSMYHCGYVFIEHVADPRGGPGRWKKIGGQWKIRPAAKT